MVLSNSVKGFLLAFLSVLAVSNVYIFSKAALAEVSFAQFGFYWFSFGMLWIFIYGYYKKIFKKFKFLTIKNYAVLLFLGIIDIIATFYFFKSIHTVTNPAIVAFIGNLSPVLVITFGFIFLNERFNKIEFIGMLLAIVGAFVISYKWNADFTSMFINGTQYILLYSVFFAINGVVIKKNISKIDPIILTINRTVFLLFFSVMLLLYTNDSIEIPQKALTNIFIGSILGPFLTIIFAYGALQYIPLSRKAIVDSTRGLFVLLGAYIYFGQFPSVIAIIGGFITIGGVLLIAFGKIRMNTSKQ
ncbi:DMT family transporter [Lutibacter sp.]|uniref:DMT family transporter n=1 Tax=Lutibacter sp. TaxID=1925666 RepID=UPI002734CB41|nr:DMT family transporter [Lutibacter sp.]MDP3312982.1 DMT family transporter [Lutibacter sp.]